jgi:hypothetical protein
MNTTVFGQLATACARPFALRRTVALLAAAGAVSSLIGLSLRWKM